VVAFVRFLAGRQFGLQGSHLRMEPGQFALHINGNSRDSGVGRVGKGHRRKPASSDGKPK